MIVTYVGKHGLEEVKVGFVKASEARLDEGRTVYVLEFTRPPTREVTRVETVHFTIMNEVAPQ